MKAQPKRTSTIQFSLIPEFSWWKSKDERRLLCVTDIYGKGVGSAYRTTEVGIVEVGIMEKRRIPYDLFAHQIRQGNLIQVHFIQTGPLVRSFLHRV